MVPFAGYSLPVHFDEGIIKEHEHTRSKAGLFDVTHMGQIILSGDKISETFESLVCSNIRDLKNGKTQYTVITNNAGGIIDI